MSVVIISAVVESQITPLLELLFSTLFDLLSHMHIILSINIHFSLSSFVDYILNTIQTCKRYFDFFEEAFNYIAYKGYIRMRGDDEQEWLDTMNHVHAGVKGGMKYNTGKLLLVMYKPLVVAEEGEFP